MIDDVARRRFLAGLGKTGACLAAGSWLDVIGYAQVSRGPARAFIQPSRAPADFNRRVLGACTRARAGRSRGSRDVSDRRGGSPGGPGTSSFTASGTHASLARRRSLRLSRVLPSGA